MSSSDRPTYGNKQQEGQDNGEQDAKAADLRCISVDISTSSVGRDRTESQIWWATGGTGGQSGFDGRQPLETVRRN